MSGLKKAARFSLDLATWPPKMAWRGAQFIWDWLFGKVMQWGKGFMQYSMGQGMGSGDGEPQQGEGQEGESQGQGQPEQGNQEKKGDAPMPGGKGHGGQNAPLPKPKVKPEDLEDTQETVRKVCKKLCTKMSRKRKKGKKKEMPDFRSTLRGSMKYGGVVAKVKWKNKQIDKPKIVLVCDTSGSMTRHTEMTMMFMHGIASELSDYEAFIFANRLERVTDKLVPDDFDKTMEKVSRSRSWGGGTDVGGSLRELIQGHPGILSPRTTFILMTDCETSNPMQEAKVLQEIKNRVKRVILLNPDMEMTLYSRESYKYNILPFEKASHQAFRIKDLLELEYAVDRIMV